MLRKLIVSICLVTAISGQECVKKKFESDSVVCVCNSTYCDDLPLIHRTSEGTVTVFTSSLSGERFTRHVVNAHKSAATRRKRAQSDFWILGILTSGSFPGVNNTEPDATFTISAAGDRQTVLGFGGAMTDAAALNIHNLTPPAQDRLLMSYFAANGAQYQIVRVNIAGCDFSTRPYSYADTEDDFDLQHFELAEEDTEHKIPLILAAQKIAGRKLTVFGSPWSAPKWLKSSDKFTDGTLKGQAGDKYHKTWANYFVKFVQAYEKSNVTIWGLTAQNEPIDGYIPNFSFNAMGFTAATQREFITKDLGPALTNAGLRRVKLMILDDQRLLLPEWADKVLVSNESSQFVDGIAVHWYLDKVVSPSRLSDTHDRHPDKFILSTEACTGSTPYAGKVGVVLGDWGRAESYANDIIQDLSNWIVGWTDWNLVLDTEGGPNWANNFVDSPVIVNATADEFYKQPMFYALSHFSKFIIPQSVIVKSSLSLKWDGYSKRSKSSANGLELIAAQRPDGGITVVALNKASRDLNVKFVDGRLKRSFVYTVTAKSIQSYIWW